jgi:hypothetical protein
MKPIPLKVDENILSEAEKIISLLHTSRNNYINKAIEYYNKMMERELLTQQLKEESLMCREESMNVLSEFDQLNDEIN